ncbi:MAG: signal peptidase I [Clostridia bacterium]|nr:signal peptidase I [Clostridia bacterium]MBQ1966267.1 signal peptidase I [Clostridia bacterium]MBQ5743075.1 signal peptidase I [Clostridia bacterium]
MNVVKKIWNVVSTVLVALIVLCAVFLMGSRLIGYQCYTVISGSMQPTYEVGDLLYVKKVDVNTIKEGDPITFVLNEDLVVATHRVVKVDAANQRFYTKGDANDIPDGDPVHFKNVIGVPQFSIPWLGYVSDFVQNPPGMYITIAVGVILIVAVFAPDLIGKKKKTDPTPELAAVQAECSEATEENQRLKAEIEALRAQMKEKDPQ